MVIYGKMFETGLLKNQKEPREITIGMLDFDVKNHLMDIGDKKYVDIISR